MKISLKPLATGLLAVAALMSVSACVPLLLGGVVAGGLVATDRRTSGTVVEDEGIELKAAARIRENLGNRVHVNVTSYNRQVLLTGEVPNDQDKALVEQVVGQVENVRNTVNELGVMGITSFSQRSNDVVISTRVKATLLDARDLFANSFKVVTERGIVYVMGRVTQREANRVTDIVTATPGVQRMVRVLEIVSEEELARTLPTPSAAPAPQK